jgi:hypothetical protein
MFAADGVLALLLFVFWIWAILDVVVAERHAVRNLPKLLWLVIVLLFSALGAGAWVAFGRPNRASRARQTTDSVAQRRPIGVEDLPQFSAPTTAMSDRRSAELDRQLDEWEAEQRRKHGEPE